MKRTAIVVAAASAAASLAFSAPAFAYSEADGYEVTNEGNYVVTDHYGERNTAVLFAAVQPKYSESKATYEFYCEQGDFPDYDGTGGGLVYEFWGDQGRPAGSAGDLDVQSYQFGLEDGVYRFSYAVYTKSGVYVLNSALEAPFGTFNHTVDVSGGEEVRLYALVGDEDWVREHAHEMEDYAVKRESTYASNRGGGETTTIEEKGSEEEPPALEEPKEPKATFTDKGPTEPQPVPTEAVEEDGSASHGKAVVGGVAAFMVLFLAYWMSSRPNRAI